MYLSRLILNPRNPKVRRDLADVQEMHRTVMSAFPDLGEGGEGARARLGVLFRVELDRRGGFPAVLVQSAAGPDWSGLPEGYLAETDGPNPACKSVLAAYQAVRPGQVLAFRLRANPTRKIDTKSGPDGVRRNGHRVELRDEEKRLDWMRRKAAEGGFELVSVRTAPEVPDVRATPEAVVERGHGGAADGRGRLTFAAVTFEGHLRVTNPREFLEKSLMKGIGPGKAFGMGLLSIAPPAR